MHAHCSRILEICPSEGTRIPEHKRIITTKMDKMIITINPHDKRNSHNLGPNPALSIDPLFRCIEITLSGVNFISNENVKDHFFNHLSIRVSLSYSEVFIFHEIVFYFFLEALRRINRFQSLPRQLFVDS